MSHLTNWSQLPKLPNFCFCTNTSSPVCSTARRPLLEGVWRAATVSLIQIQSTHSWNSILTKLGRWTPRKSLYVTSSTGSHSPPSCPANIFFLYCQSSWVTTVIAACSYSSASYAYPKDRSTRYNGTQKSPSSDKEGQRTSWNLIPNLKFQTPGVCAAQGCHPSQAGLHWFARCHSEKTTLDVTSICHTDKTQASPVCSGCNSLSRGLHPSIRTWITGGLKSTRFSGDAVGPTRKTVAENKLVAARATLLPATWAILLPATCPLPHIRGAPGKSKAGNGPSAGKTALAGLWDRSGHRLDASGLA